MLCAAYLDPLSGSIKKKIRMNVCFFQLRSLNCKLNIFFVCAFGSIWAAVAVDLSTGFSG